jgi:osmotically-inducible protein OsmY
VLEAIWKEAVMMQSPLHVVVIVGLLLAAGCSAPTKKPDVTNAIKDALKQVHLQDVAVSDDRDKGLITLTGTLAEESDRVRAGEIARSIAGNQVVANEIAVVPRGIQTDAQKVNKDLDEAIKKMVDAVLIRQSLHDSVKYDVKNGVVILTGKLNSEATRNAIQKIVAEVPNVRQVVNKLDVNQGDQKATSTP